jgi:hypothetical protein
LVFIINLIKVPTCKGAEQRSGERHLPRMNLEVRPNLRCTSSQVNMSKARAATDVVVKLIVGAGQASPSPPVGPALGSKGVKSMDFCKVSTIALAFHGKKGTGFNRAKVPDSSLENTLTNIELGVQCENGTYDTWYTHPRKSYGSTRSILSF